MHRYLSPADFKFMTILWAVMFLLGAGLMAVEYRNSLPKPGDRLVEGQIVNVELKETTYYSGDPTQRVFLQQETSPLMGMVLFLIIALTVILGTSAVLLLYKMDEHARHNEYKALLEKIKQS